MDKQLRESSTWIQRRIIDMDTKSNKNMDIATIESVLKRAWLQAELAMSEVACTVPLETLLALCDMAQVGLDAVKGSPKPVKGPDSDPKRDAKHEEDKPITDEEMQRSIAKITPAATPVPAKDPLWRSKPRAKTVRTEKRGTTEQGAFCAIFADGAGLINACKEVGWTYNIGLGAVAKFSENIKALKALPPGQARYDYLQKWFGFGDPGRNK